MLTKPIFGALLLALLISAILSGCQSSKIAYGNSYYFKQTPRATAPEAPLSIREVPSEIPKMLEVALEPEISAPTSLIEQAQARLKSAMAHSENNALKAQAQRVTQLAQSMQQEEVNAREKRVQRQALRKEIKQLKKQVHAAPDETNQMDRNLRIAIILLIAGLILGLIPVLPLQIVGWLAFLAGLIFLLIWLVNEA